MARLQQSPPPRGPNASLRRSPTASQEHLPTTKPTKMLNPSRRKRRGRRRSPPMPMPPSRPRRRRRGGLAALLLALRSCFTSPRPRDRRSRPEPGARTTTKSARSAAAGVTRPSHADCVSWQLRARGAGGRARIRHRVAMGRCSRALRSQPRTKPNGALRRAPTPPLARKRMTHTHTHSHSHSLPTRKGWMG